MRKTLSFLCSLFAITALLLTACAQATPTVEPTKPPLPEEEMETPEVEEPEVEESEEVGERLPFPGELEGMTWDEILAAADGQTVKWWQWGGSDLINTWITGDVADAMKERYNITVNLVPVVDATEFVNKVLGEKEAGRDTDGAVDVMWINGENFRTMKDAELLYGPWAYYITSAQYYNFDLGYIAYDQGYPVEGYEFPYGLSQWVLTYDSAKVPDPPSTFAELVEWIKANPGKFTYPGLPDFNGSGVVRHFFIWESGGVDQFMGPFDEDLYLEKSPAVWDLLNELEPYLWREGETYPAGYPQLTELFGNGEVWIEMHPGPGNSSSNVVNGLYPETTRDFVLDDGTEVSSHFLAIAYNSPNKAAALVLINFLASPEAVHQRALPEIWGAGPIIDYSKLPTDWQEKFDAIPRGVAALSMAELQRVGIPQIQSTWRVRIEKDWETFVLQQ